MLTLPGLVNADAVRRYFRTTLPSGTVAVIVMEPSDRLSHQRLHRLVDSSLAQQDRSGGRLAGTPLGLLGKRLRPQIDEDAPMLRIHNTTICAPGGQRELADLIARLSVEPYDRPEAGWKAWIIDGLAGGRWALAVVTSPALDIARSGPEYVWSRLLRSGPHEDPADDPQATGPGIGAPRLDEFVSDTITGLLENYVRSLWLTAAAASGAVQAARGMLSGLGELRQMPPAVSSRSGPVPDSVFNAPLTRRRTVAFASIPRADLDAVSHAFGGTVTNAFLAACTLSLRGWLERYATVPDEPLLMRVPLPLSGGDSVACGDALAVGRIGIPVQLNDPVQVLVNLHTATDRLNSARLRNAEKSSLSLDLARLTKSLPRPVRHAAKRLDAGLGLWQRHPENCHGNVSYFSGRPAPAYCAGVKVVGMQTVDPLQGCGLNIAVTARGDVLDLSVCVCPDNVPAVDDIATGIADSVDVLVAAAHEFPRGQGRSVVTQMTSHVTKHSLNRRH
ncbi:hypothetical protein A4G26_23420 [Mycobacterium kansasii]|uniref:Diacylglycerol O-acyltransferase n=1 Tax=Mycobacterium innocens TaxID=2341083 RepID=A0A498PRE0_9MYCO|nr:wax ester/triacylglycerol synthase domain-containing protein [Mycobacterium kansasii]KZS73901.1 hypothetical protein A4G26_23420 [Mycobacterium kansasii]VBA35197.1 Putative diacylglycerol O-acyltransferase [Mycobacterium innocens]